MAVRLASKTVSDSSEAPPAYLHLAIRAQAMGLVAGAHWLEPGAENAAALLAAVARAGVAIAARGQGVGGGQLAAAAQALEDCPFPSTEWAAVESWLGAELMETLLGISESSLRRYSSGGRLTPDLIATRLHFLAMVIADLAGSYNGFGVRRWFGRSRTALGGRTPVAALSGEWDPDDLGPRAVRGLAQSLTDSGST
jgi:hypothetical protein